MVVSFKKIKKLGAGQFGEVWLAKDTGLNTEVAVKFIHPSNVQNPNNLFQEAQTLKATEHLNVVHVDDTGELQDGKIYIAMEYLKAGSVGEKIKTSHLDLISAKKIMIDALRGLEHAHSQGILHRDIKPANILIGPNGEGKLSDFGLAIPEGTQPTTNEAYFSHLSPEVYSNKTFSVLSDIYACGVTLYRLINGDSYLPRLPFLQTREACILGKYPDRKRYRLFISKPLKMVANKAMSVNPDDRYQSAQEMRHALERIAIRASWVENTGNNFTQWGCNKPNMCYEVTQINIAANQWNIIVKKGKPQKPLRKISCMCETNLSKANAEKATKSVLQAIVRGKRI